MSCKQHSKIRHIHALIFETEQESKDYVSGCEWVIGIGWRAHLSQQSGVNHFSNIQKTCAGIGKGRSYGEDDSGPRLLVQHIPTKLRSEPISAGGCRGQEGARWLIGYRQVSISLRGVAAKLRKQDQGILRTTDERWSENASSWEGEWDTKPCRISP